MEKIKVHPWVTENGKNTMLSTKENCPEDQLGNDDLDGAIKPAFKGVCSTLIKVMNGMFGKPKRSQPLVISSPSRGIKQATVKIVHSLPPTHAPKNITDTAISLIRNETFASPNASKNNKSF